MKPRDDGLIVPKTVKITRSLHGIRFQGNAAALLHLGELWRRLAQMPDGTLIRTASWTLGLYERQPLSASKTLIAMPLEAWNIFASKINEVVTGREPSPFDFSRCGFLWPPPDPDIGVELIGPPIE